MNKTCFVIMPIGDVVVDARRITAHELRERYDDLIKEAIQRERPDLEVVRADDVSTAPGGITTDVFTRLMHSDYVVADVSYQNPNVFYELGIRHACRPGTVLIKERGVGPVPFDIAGLRHIEYENTASGLKALALQLQEKLTWFDLHPGDPDNEFLSLARLTGYHFQQYGKDPEQEAAATSAAFELLRHPDIVELLARRVQGEELDPQELMGRLSEHPEAFKAVLSLLVKTGKLRL